MIFHVVVRKQCSLNEPVVKLVFCIPSESTQCKVIRVPKYKVNPTQNRRDQEEGSELDCHEEARQFCESRQDQEEVGELDFHEEARQFCESRQDQEEEGELDSHEEARHFLRVQARSRGGRKCWNLQLAQKRSRAGRWSWAQKVGLLLLRLFLNSNATDIFFLTLLRTAVKTATA